MAFYEETTERNDRNNWVKNRLIEDNNFNIISFEGYTVKDNKVTALFDRRKFKDFSFDNLSDEDIENIISQQEPFLKSKLLFSEMLNVDYYYIFYQYLSDGEELLYSFRYNIKKNYSKPRVHKFDNFCSFIKGTEYFRDLNMLSRYQENNIPQIDRIFRERCNYA